MGAVAGSTGTSLKAMVEPEPGFRLDIQQANHIKDREQRRARQEAYRRELNSQVADGVERRELNARRIKELEERNELKLVSLVNAYCVWRSEFKAHVRVLDIFAELGSGLGDVCSENHALVLSTNFRLPHRKFYH